MSVRYKDRTIFISKALSEDGTSSVEMRYDRYDNKFYFVDATGAFKDLTGTSYVPTRIPDGPTPEPTGGSILNPESLSSGASTAGTLTSLMGYNAFPDGDALETYWFEFDTDTLEALGYTIEERPQITNIAIPIFSNSNPTDDSQDNYNLVVTLYDATADFTSQSDLENLSDPIAEVTTTRSALGTYLTDEFLFKVVTFESPIDYSGNLIIKVDISGHNQQTVLDLGVYWFKQNPPVEPDPFAALTSKEAYLGTNSGFFTDNTLGAIQFNVEI